jgi:hypothetical protein
MKKAFQLWVEAQHVLHDYSWTRELLLLTHWMREAFGSPLQLWEKLICVHATEDHKVVDCYGHCHSKSYISHCGTFLFLEKCLRPVKKPVTFKESFIIYLGHLAGRSDSCHSYTVETISWHVHTAKHPHSQTPPSESQVLVFYSHRRDHVFILEL